MQRLKIGVVGHLGSIGSRHYKNFQQFGCDVIGYDSGDQTTLDIDNLDSCNGIVIAAPTSVHYSWLKHFDTRGIPVFVEKPIVANREEVCWDGNGPVKMVGYNLRFHSCVKKVRRWLGAGLIGKPIWSRFTCAQFNDRPAYLRDGVILNWSHEIDLSLYLLGRASFVTASAFSHNGYNEDIADIILNHRTIGCQTLIHLDYLTKPERRGFIIVGEAGSIECDLVARQAYCKDANGGLLHNYFGRDSFDSNYISEAKAFLSILKGKLVDAEVKPCSAEEALRVVDICFQAKECSRAS